MTDFDLTTNRVPWGLLTDEEQAALKAWPHGWEFFATNWEWDTSHRPDWYSDVIYRAKPAPLPKPQSPDDRIAELEAQLAEARELLAESSKALPVYIAAEYPEEYLSKYNSAQVQFERDMDLVYRINAKLTD